MSATKGKESLVIMLPPKGLFGLKNFWKKNIGRGKQRNGGRVFGTKE